MKVVEIIDAIEQNGYKQIRGNYIKFVEGVLGNERGKENVLGACAIGQAALNLNVQWSSLEDALENIMIRQDMDLAATIIELNDSFGLSCQKIAKEIREKYPEILDKEVDLVKNSWDY